MNGLAPRRTAAAGIPAGTKSSSPYNNEKRRNSFGRARRTQMSPPNWKWMIAMATICIGVVLYAGRHHVTNLAKGVDPNVAIKRSDELLGLRKFISRDAEVDQQQDTVDSSDTTIEEMPLGKDSKDNDEEVVPEASEIQQETSSENEDSELVEAEDDVEEVLVNDPEFDDASSQVLSNPIDGGAEFAPVSKFNPVAQVKSSRKRTYVSFRSYPTELLGKDPTWKNFAKYFPGTPPEILFISYQAYSKYRGFANTIINQVGSKGGSCIGGGKGKQLACKHALVEPYQCTYDSLKIQPPQWNIKIPDQCTSFFEYANAEGRESDRWIMKPGAAFHGDGIEIHTGTKDLASRFASCTASKNGIIVQAYLAQPVLWKSNKFDFRTYLLLASTKPLIAFTHEGFVRRAGKVYNSESSDPDAAVTNARSQGGTEHFYGFEAFQTMLTEDHGFEPDYLSRVFEPHNNRVSLFLMMTAQKGLERRYGRFQLYALDWMMDSDGSFHLLESNGNPVMAHYPGTGLTPAIFETQIELVHMIHAVPKTIPGDMSVRKKFTYGKWKLIFNQLEEEMEPEDQRYNPCKLNDYAKEKHPLYSFE